jgi:hypothetical protein
MNGWFWAALVVIAIGVALDWKISVDARNGPADNFAAAGALVIFGGLALALAFVLGLIGAAVKWL